LLEAHFLTLEKSQRSQYQIDNKQKLLIEQALFLDTNFKSL
jgi:hypothetical protein